MAITKARNTLHPISNSKTSIAQKEEQTLQREIFKHTFAMLSNNPKWTERVQEHIIASDSHIIVIMPL